MVIASHQNPAAALFITANEARSLAISNHTTHFGVSADDATWGDVFALTYQEKSHRRKMARHRRRARRVQPSVEATAARRANLAAAQARMDARYAEARHQLGFTGSPWEFITFHARAGDPDAKRLWRADMEVAFLDQRRARREAQRLAIRQRLSLGYRWPGGLIAGNQNYARAPFVYPGLVSDEHPILKLFVASTPRAARLQTGDTKARVECCGQKLLALDSAYVTSGKAMCRILRVELDRVFAGGFDELAVAVAARGVPPPNLVVGHLDPTGRLLNPHLIWLLEHAVAFTDRSRRGNQSLWRAVLDGLTAALLPIGADPGGRSNAHHMKNPLCPAWHRQVLAAAPYTLTPDTREGAAGLAALAPGLDLSGARALLRQAAESHPIKSPVADHPDPAVASQSNAVFRRLSRFARERVGWYRDQGHGCKAEFRQELLAEALQLVPTSDAAERQIAAVVRSVVAWTWENYRRPPARPPCATPEERRARAAAGQAKGAATRREATIAVLIEKARDFAERGQPLRQTVLAMAAGKSERTVRHLWPIILSAIQTPAVEPSAKPAVQIPIDKKESPEVEASLVGLKGNDAARSPRFEVVLVGVGGLAAANPAQPATSLPDLNRNNQPGPGRAPT